VMGVNDLGDVFGPLKTFDASSFVLGFPKFRELMASRRVGRARSVGGVPMGRHFLYMIV
jgi:hypothetical protein